MLVKYPTVKYVDGENPWVSYAKKKVYKDNSCINLICVGPPGSGKSYSLLGYFLMIDPDFNLDEQCFFRAKPLLKFFKSKKDIKGKPFLYDESGIDSGNLDWQNPLNRSLNAFFQTARYRNYIFGTTVPFKSQITKGIRTMMTIRFKAKGWNSKNENIVDPQAMEYNDDIKKMYFKRLLVKMGGKTIRCGDIKLPRISKTILKEYEKRKDEFATSVYEEGIDKIEAKELMEKKNCLVKCSIVVKALGINRATMLNWIDKGMVKARKIGDLWFMTPEQRDILLENRDFKEKSQDKPLKPTTNVPNLTW